MFEILTPFESDGRSLFRYLDNIEKQFWNNAGASDAAQVRCDVREQGDCYLLDAELPGFAKNELHIDLNGDQLTIRAQHEGDGARRALCAPRAQNRPVQPQLRCVRHRHGAHPRRVQQRHFDADAAQGRPDRARQPDHRHPVISAAGGVPPLAARSSETRKAPPWRNAQRQAARLPCAPPGALFRFSQRHAAQPVHRNVPVQQGADVAAGLGVPGDFAAQYEARAVRKRLRRVHAAVERFFDTAQSQRTPRTSSGAQAGKLTFTHSPPQKSARKFRPPRAPASARPRPSRRRSGPTTPRPARRRRAPPSPRPPCRNTECRARGCSPG